MYFTEQGFLIIFFIYIIADYLVNPHWQVVWDTERENAEKAC